MKDQRSAGTIVVGLLIVGLAVLLFFSAVGQLSVPFLSFQQKQSILKTSEYSQITSVKELDRFSLSGGLIHLFSSILLLAGGAGLGCYKNWARRLVVGVSSFHLLLTVTAAKLVPASLPFITLYTFFIFFLTHPKVRAWYIPTQPEAVEASGRMYPNINQAVAVLYFLFLLQTTASVIFSNLGFEQCEAAGIVLGNVLAMGAIFIIAFIKTGLPLKQVCPVSWNRFSLFIPGLFTIAGLGIISSEIDNIARMFFPVPEIIAACFEQLAKGGGLAVLAVGLVAPITEEAVFRGVILRGFLKHYSPGKAIMVSSLMFSLFHFNPYQIFATFWAGVLLAYLYLKTGSVLPCFFLHAFNNLHLGILPVEIPGYNSSQDLSGIVEFQPFWFDGLGALLIIVGVLLLRRMSRLDRSGRVQPEINAALGRPEA